MYHKVSYALLCLASCLSLAIVFQVACVRQADILAYQQMTKSLQAGPQEKPLPASSQHRTNVCKDIWSAQPEKIRLHTRITSVASELTLLPIEDKLDIVENLQGIRCWMQERFFLQETHPMQQVRFFQANRGTYRYSSQAFLAKTVELSFCRLPGRSLPLLLDHNRAFIQGIAQDVSFSLAGKTPQFHAEKFQASLHTHTGGDS